MFLTGELKIFNLDINTPLFELDRSFRWLAGRTDVVSSDNFFSADGYGAAIVGVVGESVFSVARNVEPTLPDDPIIIATIFLSAAC